MKTTVVQRRPADVTRPCLRPVTAGHVQSRPVLRPLPPSDAMPASSPWSTARLGVVISVIAALVATVLDATTSLSTEAIVLAVMVVAFALSCHATARRPLAHR